MVFDPSLDAVSRRVVRQLQIDRLGEAMLTDETRNKYGLSSDAVADDVFQLLYLTAFQGKAVVRILTKKPDGSAFPYLRITISKSSGNLTDVTTDSRGSYIFSASANESISVTIGSTYFDLMGSTSTTAPSTGLKEFSFTPTYVGSLTLSASRRAMFSSECKSVQYSMCGGGGGGGGGSLKRSGAGGGGGYYVSYRTVTPELNAYYTISVGSGGSNGRFTNNYGDATPGSSGGTTSAFGMSAAGGGGGSAGYQYVTGGQYAPGGTGNGNGGNGTGYNHTDTSISTYAFNGSSGTNGSGYVTIFTDTDSTEHLCGGGGGGGGSAYSRDSNPSTSTTAKGGTGGSPAGGSGGGGTRSTNGISDSAFSAGSGSNGAIYGGGGGGGGNACYSGNAGAGGDGGKGGDGIFSMRMVHKN